MAKTNEAIGDEAAGRPLWRYMPYEAFHWMIENRALFLPTIRTLRNDDPFEGSIPPTEVERIDRALDELLLDGSEAMRGLGKEAIKKTINENVEASTRSFVHCWHKKAEESTAMWQIYGRHKASVAVVSNTNAVREVFPEPFRVGKVEYVEYDEFEFENPKPEKFMFQTSFVGFKRKEFDHEHEYRILLLEKDLEPDIQSRDGVVELPNGLVYPIPDFSFIDRVVTHYELEDHVTDLVKGLCEKAKISNPEKSSLAKQPIHVV